MEKITNFLIRFILHVICRIDASQLKAVPEKGPLILVTNHVNFPMQVHPEVVYQVDLFHKRWITTPTQLKIVFYLL